MKQRPCERLPGSANPLFPGSILRAARSYAPVQDLNTKVLLEFHGTPNQSYASRATNWRGFFPGCQPSNRQSEGTCVVALDRPCAAKGYSFQAHIGR